MFLKIKQIIAITSVIFAAPRKWNCRRCTYMNTAEERTCVMCGQEC